jgi:nucleoside-diphosphate-sugar epimerase
MEDVLLALFSFASSAAVVRRYILKKVILPKNKIVIIGASGVIGQRLVEALANRGWIVVAALHRSPLPASLSQHPNIVQEFGFNIRDADAVNKLISKHALETFCVWNLAAPLSVETQNDPNAAEDVTVNGMRRVLKAMKTYGVRRVCFSDSIGSYGATSPREDVSAGWLLDYPLQDPGSEYGRQKRRCRELMNKFSCDTNGGDTRWAVIPGVLHDSKSWGAGTTEYALEALRCAAHNEPFLCPVSLEKSLPMIHIEDLVRGLVLLTEIDRLKLNEPQGGYALAGFSFTPLELFAEICRSKPQFSWKPSSGNLAAHKFAQLWPCSLSTVEAQTDLGFEPQLSFQQTVRMILASYE